MFIRKTLLQMFVLGGIAVSISACSSNKIPISSTPSSYTPPYESSSDVTEEPASSSSSSYASETSPYDSSSSVESETLGSANCSSGVTYKIGKPYKIDGMWYYPHEDYAYEETGMVSWYGGNGDGFAGKKTANGEVFDPEQLTAAHRTLPLPSIIEVTNLENGRSVKLRVNDRGPFARDRILDVSRKASQLLGFSAKGQIKARVKILVNESKQLKDAVVACEDTAGYTPASAATGAPMALVEDDPYASPYASELSASEQTATPVAATGDYYVQLAAFSSEESARSLAQQVNSTHPTKVMEVQINNTTMYRVRSGPVASEAEAQQLLNSLHNEGFSDARIVKEVENSAIDRWIN